MQQFSQMEINSIREIVAGHITSASKLSTYANQIKDANLKQMFQSSSTQAEQGAQKLIQLL